MGSDCISSWSLLIFLLDHQSCSVDQSWKLLLTHISLASYFGDIGKQYRPSWDAAFSGSTLCAYRNFYKKWNKNGKNTPDSPKIESGFGKCGLITVASHVDHAVSLHPCCTELTAGLAASEDNPVITQSFSVVSFLLDQLSTIQASSL